MTTLEHLKVKEEIHVEIKKELKEEFSEENKDFVQTEEYQ